jgi:glutamate N-acetyltransferase/amino-acid N-acetyltransferase
MADTPRIDDAESAAYGLFFNALYAVNERIAKSIVRDGEGATKFIEVSVINAESVFEAKLLAKAVIKSNLVKTAFYGEDANWGRVLSSIGASGVQFDPNTVDLIFSSARGSLKLLEKGIPVAFDETAATEILSEKDIDVLIDMGMGIYRAKAWGCDLSHEYVHINSDYRS